jgi:hypothetical protein
MSVASEVKELSDAVAAKQGALVEKLERLQVGLAQAQASGVARA